MIRNYADRPVDPAIVDRALRNATHAPSAGFSQGWGFLVLDTPEDVRRWWTVTTDPESLAAPDDWLTGMMRAPVVIVPCSSKAAYLSRYAEQDKGWTDQDEARWPVPFWHIDTGMAALLILQTVTDADLNRATASGTIPKYTAPSPSSTAVCRISSAAIPVSMCQNGTGHRDSSLSVQPLSACA